MKIFLFVAASALSVLIVFNSCCGNTCNSSESVDSEPISLFANNDLSAWSAILQDTSVTMTDVVSLSDGVMTIKGQPFGVIHTKEVYSNYKLHVEWRWGDTTGVEKNWINSGIFVHVQPATAIWPNAVECQLCNGRAGDFVLIGGSDLAEFVVPEGQERPEYPVIERIVKENEKLIGEWNTANITCNGDSINVVINDVQQNLGSKAKFTSGYIGLQSEGCPVQFRNVTLTSIR